MVGAYDPAGGSYAFSVIGYSGTPVAGLGDTGNSRWDDSFKYRLDYGPAHFGAIYKFADGNGGCNYTGALVAPKTTAQTCYAAHNDAGQVGAGISYAGFDFDGVLGYYPPGRFLRHSEQHAGLWPRPGSQQHLHPERRRRRHLDRREHQHPGWHDFRQHRLARSPVNIPATSGSSMPAGRT